jgi:glycosyltransferase involved in cell wall biosynthesis
MPEYINPHKYIVHLQGPDGKVIQVRSRQKVVLPEYFDKYCLSGFIKRINGSINYTKQNIVTSEGKSKPSGQNNMPRNNRPTRQFKAVDRTSKADDINKSIKMARVIRQKALAKGQKIVKPDDNTPKSKSKIIGKNTRENASVILKSNLTVNAYPISNDIGVGILSYNRKDSLERLINSILATTDLLRTTVFISDDCSSDISTKEYLSALSKHQNIVVIRNEERLGVAGNSNRLLRCLSRFKYGVLLNDDVEILQQNWEHVIVEAMQKTMMHHLMYRQVGVYGASYGESCVVNGIELGRVDDKPHGAVLAYTNTYFEKCGYFDESYGIYGMEHVDWSSRGHELGLQTSGFYDIKCLNQYLKIHADQSSIEDKSVKLAQAREVFKRRKAGYVAATDRSAVPSISYVIPFRDIGRNSSIATVVKNIKAQRYPNVEIILVEQDDTTKIEVANYEPAKYYLAATNNRPFNKSMAFNLGVSKATYKKIVLHDADMLTQGHYTAAISAILDKSTACHMGNRVIYADANSTNRINKLGAVDAEINCDRVVGYFEGGSLACTSDAYWHCGGFNEDFWGYGVEDCEFYNRLSSDSNWQENRIFDFLHLYHGRVDGWNDHHTNNKKIDAQLRKLSMQDRIAKQYAQLRSRGYQLS